MKKCKPTYFILFSLILLSFLPGNLPAQPIGKIFSQYYTTKDYSAGAQNWEITQSKDGIIYVANQAGLLRYDSESWDLYKLSKTTTIRTLEIADDGKILVGGINELGYFAPDKKGKLQYHSLLELIDTAFHDFGDIWTVKIVGNSWFYQSDKYIFQFREKSCKTYKNTGQYFYLNYVVDNQLYSLNLGKGLYKFESDSFKLMPEGEFFADKRILTILPWKDKLLIGTRDNGLYIYEPGKTKNNITSVSQISEKAKELNDFLIQNEIYSGIIVDKNKYAIGTIDGGALILNDSFEVLDAINKETCGQVSTIYDILYARDGILWLATDNGILKVELSTPFRYWDVDAGITGNITDFAEFDKSCYIATTMGVFFLDKENIEKPYGLNKFIPTNITEQAWSYILLNQKSVESKAGIFKPGKKVLGKYQIRDKGLLIATSKGIYSIDNKKGTLISAYEKIYFMYPSVIDSSLVYLGLRDGLARMSYQQGIWYDDGKLPFIGQQIYGLAQDQEGNLWFSWGTKGLSKIPAKFLDRMKYPDLSLLTNEIVHFDEGSGIPTLGQIGIYNLKSEVKFYCDSGDYIFNHKTSRFEKDPTVGDNYIDSTWSNEVFLDAKKRFWINALEKNKTDGKYYADSLTFKRIRNYNISKIFRANDKRVWIGTPEGVFCFDEKYFKDYRQSYPAMIKRVLLNDSIIYYGYNVKSLGNDTLERYELVFSAIVNHKPDIPYRLNSISFSYAATSYEAGFKKEYSYYLQGYDKGWSNWGPDTKKAYTNLPEGKYVFRVKARNFYGIESTEAVFEFRILTPWFRSWWAYLIYLVLITLGIYFILKIYTYRLQLEKERLENIVLARTQEILMQNEEIIVQAENLREANEKIQLKNKELEAQKTELEISNATKNKFFRIIAHDLRNPISTFVNTTNHMLEDYESRGVEKTKVFLTELNKLSKTTYNLLENLLEWSTNQMGDIKFEPKKINLSFLIKENIELVSHLLEIKMIKIYSSVPKLIEVVADEHMINAVVRNLLSNAVKFTGENGKIEISHAIINGYCKINIADTGVGIEEEDIDKLFRIDKHHSTFGTGNEKGSGLGLILCKDFIEKNGGEIFVESSPGKGSTFSFTLKLA
jgi:signal transduction histidine kinase/ligand-binding sensor domain-containing protein